MEKWTKVVVIHAYVFHHNPDRIPVANFVQVLALLPVIRDLKAMGPSECLHTL